MEERERGRGEGQRGGGGGQRGGRDEERVRGREAAETESSKPQTVIFGFPFGELPFISFVFQDTPVPGGRAGASVLGSYCLSVSAATATGTTDAPLGALHLPISEATAQGQAQLLMRSD